MGNRLIGLLSSFRIKVQFDMYTSGEYFLKTPLQEGASL